MDLDIAMQDVGDEIVVANAGHPLPSLSPVAGDGNVTEHISHSAATNEMSSAHPWNEPVSFNIYAITADESESFMHPSQQEIDSKIPFQLDEDATAMHQYSIPIHSSTSSNSATSLKNSIEQREEEAASRSSSTFTSEHALKKALKDQDKVVVLIKNPPDPILPYSSRRTGLVYDHRMRFHMEIGVHGSREDDDEDLHPEDPRRIYEIFDELSKNGLIEPSPQPESQPPLANQSLAGYQPQRLLRIKARPVLREEVLLVHTEKHYDWVHDLEHFSDEERYRMAKGMNSVYLHSLTFYCAALAAGGAIEACRAVVSGTVKNAMAVIRPPGHHAEHDKAGGFCFFNNVCVATRVCQKDFGAVCRKVLILDWDVHHGNGIQNIFEDDPNVLYISLHVYRGGAFYPHGDAGSHDKVGTGLAEGKNINIPWPQHQMGDGDYLHAFQQVVMPVAQEFNPDLVVIAAGFDAAKGDALGQCLVTPAGFAHMTHMLMSLAGGKVVACLEGGYNLRSHR